MVLNYSLDDNEEVYSKESKEKYKDNESHPTYSFLSYPLANHKIEKVVFMRLRLDMKRKYRKRLLELKEVKQCKLIFLT